MKGTVRFQKMMVTINRILNAKLFFSILLHCSSESYLKVDLVNKLEDVIEKQRSKMKSLDQMVLDCKSGNEEVS
jgi:hypothetical protein